MFCETNNDLIIHISAASTRYFEVCTDLMHAAAQGTPARFQELQHQCQVCKDECDQAREALRVHRKEHDCQESKSEFSKP